MSYQLPFATSAGGTSRQVVLATQYAHRRIFERNTRPERTMRIFAQRREGKAVRLSPRPISFEVSQH